MFSRNVKRSQIENIFWGLIISREDTGAAACHGITRIEISIAALTELWKVEFQRLEFHLNFLNAGQLS